MKNRNAFSMLELIFVIVILGIVSSIGAEIIAKVYAQYIVQRAQHRASLKTELAALQIANRLRYMIPGTVYRIKNDDSLESMETSFSGSGEVYKGIQWVGFDGDSFETVSGDSSGGANPRRPGWSGFIDLNSSDTDTDHLKTPGSDLSLTNSIISHLSPTSRTIADAVVYFPYDLSEHNISSVSGDIITLATATNRHIVEQYKLAWSSYALVVESGDLYLYYDFAPRVAATRSSTTPRQLLLHHVSTFKFKGAGKTIRFKICRDEPIGEDYNITSCKEKAVF
jgi:prepilin-type N-terminal cleavage/methylation domain-containing protein